MLAELAIANAAFGVIKETIANGGDIMAAGQHIFKFFDSKSEIAKKANASGSDSEAFFALEQIKQNEKDLQEMFIYQGRAGLWDEKIWAWVNGVLIIVAVVTGLVVIAGLVWLVTTKGGNA
jgi:cytochrome b subunit of formate dehydrogenase